MGCAFPQLALGLGRLFSDTTAFESHVLLVSNPSHVLTPWYQGGDPWTTHGRHVSSQHLTSRDLTLVIRLGSKHLYPPSLLTSLCSLLAVSSVQPSPASLCFIPRLPLPPNEDGRCRDRGASCAHPPVPEFLLGSVVVGTGHTGSQKPVGRACPTTLWVHHSLPPTCSPVEPSRLLLAQIVLCIG